MIFLIYKSYKDIYHKFIAKTDKVHTINNLIKNILTDYTSKEAFSIFNNPNNDINLNIIMNQFNMSSIPLDNQNYKDESFSEEVNIIKSNTPYKILSYP